MKIFLILILVSTIYADDSKLESVIFDKIINVVVQKIDPKIYIHEKIESIDTYKSNFNIVANCEEADMVILSTIKDIPSTCKGKILFGTRYSHLKNEEVIGAFFWMKGRPNILFYQERLNQKNIKLDSSFDKYVEDE